MTPNMHRATHELCTEIDAYLTAYCDMLDLLDIDGRCEPTDDDFRVLFLAADSYIALQMTGLLNFDIVSWDGRI